MIKHKVTKTTTATTPPIKAWSVPCCPRALGSEERQRDKQREQMKAVDVEVREGGQSNSKRQTIQNSARRKERIISSSFLL